jgi:hypothetical protein
MEYAVEVERQILQLYTATSTGHSQSASVGWLLDFSGSPAGWSVFPALLQGSSSPEVRFYSANALYAKVRSDWSTLSQEQRVGLVGHLWGTLEGSGPVLQIALGVPLSQ